MAELALVVAFEDGFTIFSWPYVDMVASLFVLYDYIRKDFFVGISIDMRSSSFAGTISLR